MKLTTERIGDERIEIDVDQNGQFSATFNDQDYSAKTRLELVEALTRAVKKAKQQGLVEVTVLGLVPATSNRYSEDPFERGDGVVHAKLRAKHEKHYNKWLLVSDDLGVATKGGKAVRFSVSSGRTEGTIARRLTEVEAVQYLHLCEQLRVAERHLEEFVGDVKIDPEAALEAAREKKTAEV